MTWWELTRSILPVVSFVGALLAWFIRATVRTQILETHAFLLEQIDQRYVRAAGSSLTGSEIQRMLADLARDLRDIVSRGVREPRMGRPE